MKEPFQASEGQVRDGSCRGSQLSTRGQAEPSRYVAYDRASSSDEPLHEPLAIPQLHQVALGVLFDGADSVGVVLCLDAGLGAAGAVSAEQVKPVLRHCANTDWVGDSAACR